LLADVTIGIAGAGIGGLCLALALRQFGFPKVTLFEAADVDTDIPAHALELSANASRVLHALGLEAAVRIKSNLPGFTYLRNRRSGFLLIQRPLGDFSQARYGAPTYLISQRDLVNLLRDACVQHGVELNYGEQIIDVDPAAGTLQSIKSGSRSFTAIVVATGSHSPLRNFVSRHTEAADSPQAQSYQIITASCNAATTQNASFTWVDDNFYCVQYPLGNTRTDLLLVRRAAGGTAAAPSAEAQLQQLLHGSHGHLSSVLTQLEQASYASTTLPPAADHWYADKVALLGDVCHPLGAHQALGACAAIEDAWVLATMMERWEEAPAEGFFDYQRFRKPRISRMRSHARHGAEELLTGSAKDKFIRNFRWSMTSRFLPEISMAKLDWLYGYDCIKGFA
jgi:salicylate hydroxylase